MKMVRNIGLRAYAEQLLVCCGAVAVVMGVTSSADAQVTEWDAFKGRDYTQTDNNVQPTIPVSIVADSIILTTDQADITTAEMTSVAGTTPYTEFAPSEWEIFSSFGSLAELNAAFPSNTTYTINITSGSLAPSSQSFTIGPDAFPTVVPYLTGNSFDALRFLDPANDIPLTWESAASAGAGATLLAIYQFPSGGGEVNIFELSFGPSDTGFVLPGGTLTAGEMYEVEIAYGNITDVPADPSGFNVAGVVGFFSSTLIEFTAGGAPIAPSCLGDADGDSMVNFNDITSVLSNWLGFCP